MGKQNEAENRNTELKEMVAEIDEVGVGLSDWEVEFIGGMVDDDLTSFSEKQETIIRRLYDKFA